MAKKKLILTQKQIDEICGGNFSYLDGLANGPDNKDKFSTEVSSDGGMETNPYPKKPMTGDDFSSDITRDSWPRDSRSYGKNGNYLPYNMTEMKKSDWEKKNLTSEGKMRGNKRLNHMKFNPGDGSEGKTYSELNQAAYRRRVAAKKAINGSTEEEKQKGRESYARMMGDKSYQNAAKQFKNAKTADKFVQGMKPEGTKIESKPKTGNGTAHGKSNVGYITPLN